MSKYGWFILKSSFCIINTIVVSIRQYAKTIISSEATGTTQG
jgi:hypothetical protein